MEFERSAAGSGYRKLQLPDKMSNGFLSQYKNLRKEIYILFFGRVVTNLGSMVWPMLTLILSQKMGLDAMSISAVTVGAGLLMVPANLIGGRLADRCNKKWVIVCGDTVSVICYIICSAIPLGWGSVVLMLAAAVCQSMEGPSYNSLIADLSTTQDRDKAYSLQYLGANLGLVLSPTLSGLLFKNYLWLSFLISGIAIGISTILIATKIRDIHPETDTSEAGIYQQAQENTSLRTILKENRIIIIFMLGMALYYTADHQYTFLMPLEMGVVHGGDGAVIFGTVSSLNCIVVVIFTPMITRLLAGKGDITKLLTGQFLVGIGYVFFLVFLGHIPVYYLAMLLFTWGEICSTIGEGPYLSKRIPSSHRGRLNGFSSVLAFAVQSVCQLTVGRLYDKGGSLAAWTAVFIILALAISLIFVLLFQDKKHYPKLY